MNIPKRPEVPEVDVVGVGLDVYKRQNLFVRRSWTHYSVNMPLNPQPASRFRGTLDS